MYNISKSECKTQYVWECKHLCTLEIYALIFICVLAYSGLSYRAKIYKGTLKEALFVLDNIECYSNVKSTEIIFSFFPGLKD